MENIKKFSIESAKEIGKQKCLRGTKRIYSTENKREAVERFWEWADEWRNVVPKAVECIEKDLEELLQFYDFAEIALEEDKDDEQYREGICRDKEHKLF